MNPCLAPTVSGRYLGFGEREDIAALRADGHGVREIARRLGRAPSTISRELRRNASTRTWKLEYRPSVAQWHAERRARRPKKSKLARHEQLRTYVQERLAGSVQAPDGSVVAGPATRAWKGRNKPRREDRHWVRAWSPEQIARRLPIDFPDDPTMRISHEAIYQALFIDGRGGLDRHQVRCLRTGRALRVPRARSRNKAVGHVTPDTVIGKRPAEVADRTVAGHWEGDLIIGLGRSAIGTLVERTTRFTMLVHLPRLAGYGDGPRVKNGPALAGYGGEPTRLALIDRFAGLPAAMRRTLTWDRGKELAQHAELTAAIGLAVYFADPHSPWQRGSNENTNGLLRQYFPKGTDLARWSADELDAVAAALNNRPRKCLQWRTPAEVFAEHRLQSLRQAGVATTP